MLDFKEIPDGEVWELFTRDFLEALGFYIESAPDRGSDLGKDLLITETFDGKLGKYQFRWLVSCKNNAISGIGVNEKEETNLLERITGFKADGFIGFYSTIATGGLNSRLTQLKEAKSIKDYRIFDYKLIESYLISVGFSTILMRYFPKSHKLIKPLHILYDRYYPLECECCGKDLLNALYHENVDGLVCLVSKPISGNFQKIEDIYVACKGKCDSQMQYKYKELGLQPYDWKGLKDLSNPGIFIKYIISTLNLVEKGTLKYSKAAWTKEKHLILKMSQKMLIQLNESDRQRLTDLAEFGL